MTKTICNNSHKYGLWETNKEMTIGTRNCLKCSHKETLPLNINILEQIKKQEQAKKRLLNWITFPNDSTITLGAIYPLLNSELNYLSKDEQKILIKKVKEINNSSISLENQEFLTYFTNYLEIKEPQEEQTDLFYTKVEDFYTHNEKDFLNVFKEQEERKKAI